MIVREIEDPAELVEIAPAWDALLERTSGATFFHSRQWLEVYWKHFGAGRRLRVLVVHDDDRPVGILPLVVRRARRSEPVRVLTYPLDGWGYSYGPIGADPLATLTAAFDHVRRTPRDWDFIELAWIDADSDQGSIKAALDRAGLDARAERLGDAAVIDLGVHGSWDAYAASHSADWRYSLQRKEKKLAKRGAVRYERHRSGSRGEIQPDPRWDLYDACLSVSAASWQGSATVGSIPTKPEYRAYFRDCHQAAVDCGAVDTNVLFVDERPAAFSLCYAWRGHVCHSKTAYDPAFAKEGAGVVLQARSVADSFERHDHTIDLGPESLEWKRLWLTRLRPIQACLHFPRGNVRAQAVRAKRALERWLRAGREAS